MKISYTFSICLSNLSLISLSPATQGSEYLLTQRSWMSRIGTGLRKWSFSRPLRLVTTSPASSSCLRCFMTPKRDMENLSSNMLRVCPSSRNNSSSKLRRVGSARALNTSSTPASYVTFWSHVNVGRHRAGPHHRTATVRASKICHSPGMPLKVAPSPVRRTRSPGRRRRRGRRRTRAAGRPRPGHRAAGRSALPGRTDRSLPMRVTSPRWTPARSSSPRSGHGLGRRERTADGGSRPVERDEEPVAGALHLVAAVAPRPGDARRLLCSSISALHALVAQGRRQRRGVDDVGEQHRGASSGRRTA